MNITSLDALSHYGVKRVVVAIGVFDGVHLGHQLLIKKLIEMGEKERATPVALTFFPHPREVLNPNQQLPLIISPEKKEKLLIEQGVHYVVTLPFTKEFSEREPENFLNDFLRTKQVEIIGICVGKEWRFGRNGAGNTEKLAQFSKKHNMQFLGVEELTLGEQKISSTAIRHAIASGVLDDAKNMLGRYYTLSGTVIKGASIASTRLNHPTANMDINYGIIPPNGVYAAFVNYKEKRYSSVIAIGHAPTFRHQLDNRKKIEVHIFDFNDDLYGKKIEVEFVKYLREERCYSSEEGLKQQIIKDVLQAKMILGRL